MNVAETKLTDALKTRGTLSVSNTTVKYSVATEISTIDLHGNRIAEYDHSKNKLKVNFCGYATNTTRNRINAICEALGFNTCFNIKQGEVHQKVMQVKKGVVISNGWIEVTE